MKQVLKNPEQLRLDEDKKKNGIWKKWGPYLSERQWGTVREDYSADGHPWSYSTYAEAISKAYRWGEDGIAGISDIKSRLCFSVAFWNEKDPWIKERLFGLTGPEGNHGEDVKEYYYYLDNTPTHSYMKFLYKYTQEEFPYDDLVTSNMSLGRDQPEYELIDTGIFKNDKYFDIFIEYAKESPEDILIRIEIFNRSDDNAVLHIIPELWFRNTWSWNKEHYKNQRLNLDENNIVAHHDELEDMYLYFKEGDALFTENETNKHKLYKTENHKHYLKDGINEYIVDQNEKAINPENFGTKAAIHSMLNFKTKEKKVIELRLSNKKLDNPFKDFNKIISYRKEEADKFWDIFNFENKHLESQESKMISRQALSGLLWSKQFYYYYVDEWLDGDQDQPKPPEYRKHGRNKDWRHFNAEHVISMPDKWEYPWFAAWDLAFHAIGLAIVDPEFAKEQLELLTRPEFMHPNGELPAYEWNFSDVNPPVHAWATFRVYQIDKKINGKGDREFLEKTFQKLLINFTWWVNRKDIEGKNIFQGGFLGLDNIGVFDRSAKIPNGGHIEQADGSAWMAMFCLNMLSISLELAREDDVYEEMAIKFFEHFLYIADSINHIGGTGLWDDEDKFFYDKLHIPGLGSISMKIRSMVGIIPLFAIDTIDYALLEDFPKFKERFDYFLKNKPNLAKNIASPTDMHKEDIRLLSIVDRYKLEAILSKLFDTEGFLSEFGIRALSKFHKNNPYHLELNGVDYKVEYLHGESDTDLFGGNSNWRGPIWFPLNYLLIETLQKYHHYYGDDFKIEFPTGSGNMLNLWDVGEEISKRLINIFKRDKLHHLRNNFGDEKDMKKFQKDPNWNQYLFFNEYFDGDDGKGLGANHQTGWTALVAKLIHQLAEYNDTDEKV